MVLALDAEAVPRVIRTWRSVRLSAKLMKLRRHDWFVAVALAWVNFVAYSFFSHLYQSHHRCEHPWTH
jgi:prephenate dehydrogenase